jgi:hypothetical protein
VSPPRITEGEDSARITVRTGVSVPARVQGAGVVTISGHAQVVALIRGPLIDPTDPDLIASFP